MQHEQEESQTETKYQTCTQVERQSITCMVCSLCLCAQRRLSSICAVKLPKLGLKKKKISTLKISLMIILYLISQQEGLGFESKPIYVQQLACSPLASSLRYSGFLP